MLHVEVVGVADGAAFWHDQEVARSNRVRILKSDNGVVLVHNVRWFLLPNYSCKHVLAEIAKVWPCNPNEQERASSTGHVQRNTRQT